MVYYKNLLYLPYKVFWIVSHIFRTGKRIDFFCGGYVDYICFRGIHQRMPEVRIVARDRKTRKELAEHGIPSVLYPSYPDVVIMARHTAHKYPSHFVIRIGMRHGAYHFKDFVSSTKYNAFHKFLLTSKHEAELAEAKGITSGIGIGFPKIDPMFNGEITSEELASLRKKLGLDDSKKTVIFTATWDKRGYSAIDQWIDRVEEYADRYNVLVTVHHWMSPHKKEILAGYQRIHYIKDKDIMPYLMISDVMVADISSIIAEFCALDKPIVTLCVPEVRRFTSEIRQMLEEISFRAETFDELSKAIQDAIQNPGLHQEKRKFYNQMMFDELDGKASERAVEVINEYWEKI